MSSSKRTQTILIIDDDPQNLRVAVDYLKVYSYDILIAKDGETGIDRALRGGPDLILLDVQMPGIDGIETCRRLRANPLTTEIPVIFMTARTSIDDKVRAFDAGGVDYVTKPVEERELLARARAHLQIRALQKALQDQAELLAEQASLSKARMELEKELYRRDNRDKQHLLALLSQQSGELLAAAQHNLKQTDGAPVRARPLHQLARRHLEEVRRLLSAGDVTMELALPARDHAIVAIELLSAADEQAGADPPAPIAPPEDGSAAENPLSKLSQREREIVRLLVEGKANKEIAYELDVARTTVSTHRQRILDKLGIGDLSSLIKLALRHGIVS